MQKVGYHEISGKIVLVSGTRIGGSDDLLQIGGADATCIRNPVTHAPYLPGSSIKGKMRSELESRLERFGGRDCNEPCGCGDCIVLQSLACTSQDLTNWDHPGSSCATHNSLTAAKPRTSR